MKENLAIGKKQLIYSSKLSGTKTLLIYLERGVT
jgi:hypothetical protein